MRRFIFAFLVIGFTDIIQVLLITIGEGLPVEFPLEHGVIVNDCQVGDGCGRPAGGAPLKILTKGIRLTTL